MFLLTEARHIPGVLLQTSPPRQQRAGNPGNYALIDLDLSRYDTLAQRFAQAQRDALDFLKSGIATRNPAFNRADRGNRARGPALEGADLADRADGRGQVAPRTTHVLELKKSRHQVAGDFVEVNCATLQGEGAASTLFGHKKGAFTAPRATARACCARRTAACCFSTRSASWGWTSRRCC